MQRRVRPGAQLFREVGRGEDRPKPPVHREQRLAVQRMENVGGELFAPARHHDGFGEAFRVYVIASEQMDEFVRDDTQSLLSLGQRGIHPYAPRDDLDAPGNLGISGERDLVLGLREPDVLVGR